MGPQYFFIIVKGKAIAHYENQMGLQSNSEI